MAKSHLHLVPPATEKPTVVSNNPADRLDNVDYRDREHLFASEVERLIEASKDNRNGHRDATMIPMAYRHRLRAKELVELAWTQINLDEGLSRLSVRRG
jgi:integrase